MRTLVVTENITLDGVIDMSEDWFGRNTFESFRGFWPARDATSWSPEACSSCTS